MMKVSYHLLIVIFLASSCLDREVPLIQDYEDEWQLDVASQFIENPGLPVVRPVTIDYKTTSDGFLLLILNRQVNQVELGDYFLVKISPEGEIIKTLDLPSGYAMMDILDQKNAGFIFYMTTDFQTPEYIKVTVDENLTLHQSNYNFTRPLTFHTLKFTESDLFLSQYEGSFPGTRVSRFNLAGELQWTKTYNSKYIRPFPVIHGFQLFFYDQRHPDSVAVSAIDAQMGAVQWTKTYTSAQAFGVNTVNSAYYRLIENQLFLYGYVEESRRFYISKLNLSNGSKVFQKSSLLDQGSVNSWSSSLAEPAEDGGFLIMSRDENRTYLYKTDAAGNVGWKGDFLDRGVGVPVEAPNGDVYVVSDGYVFKLRAIRSSL